MGPTRHHAPRIRQMGPMCRRRRTYRALSCGSTRDSLNHMACDRDILHSNHLWHGDRHRFWSSHLEKTKFKKVYYERRNFESLINNCQTPVVIATLNVPSRCELQSVQPRLLSNDILYISEGAKEATEIYVCNLHWAWRVPVLKRTCTCVPWVECSAAILRSKLLFRTKWRIGDSVCQVGIALGGDISKTFREHFVTFARVDIGPVFLTWFFNLIHLTFHIFCANYTKVQKHS